MQFSLSGFLLFRACLQNALSLVITLICAAPVVAFGATATTTTFTITASGDPLTSVDTHSTVKLTAEVKAGSSKVTTGQISFCDAAFKHSCLDFRKVGTVQLTKDGTASLRFIPGPGEHRYKAVFLGTTTNESSESAVSTLTVNGGPAPHETKTSLSASGSAGSYTLTTNVSAPSSALPLTPGGVVYFQDKSDGNAVLGKVNLPAGPTAVNYSEIAQAYGTKAGYPSQATAVGDFNGDGKPDFVLCKENACPVVALGKGDGTFEDAPGVPALAGVVSYVQVGDFNQDGKLDVLVLYGSVLTYDQQNYFYAGAGDGTFLNPVKVTLKSPAGELGGAIGVTDFNRDGIPDLLVYYKFQIGIALGKGDGSFEVGWTTDKDTKTSFGSPVTGDFDGDGIQDIAAIAVNGGLGPPTYFFGSSDGTFSRVDFKEFRLYYGQLFPADINGDGKTELIVVDSQSSDPQDVYPGFDILETHADRTFSNRGVIGTDPIYQDTGNVIIGDFNQDGIADAAIVCDGYNSAGVYTLVPLLLLGNADGSFTQVPRNKVPASSQNLMYPEYLAAADFDGDGLPDLAEIGEQAGTNYPAYGVLLTRDGQTGVASIRPPAGARAHSVVARFSGDENFSTSVSKPVSLSAPPANAPVVSLSSTVLQFGEQPVSEPSNAKTVVLTNAGTGALAISNIALDLEYYDPASFALSHNCPATLAAGASCNIRVRFVPGSTGSKQKLLAITDNAANSPQGITLAGFGVKP